MRHRPSRGRARGRAVVLLWPWLWLCIWVTTATAAVAVSSSASTASPRIRTAKHTHFCSPEWLVDTVPLPAVVVASHLHPTEIAPVFEAPTLATSIAALQPSDNHPSDGTGGTSRYTAVDVATNFTLLVAEKPVFETDTPHVIQVQLQYETEMFNLTLHLRHDPAPAVTAYCSVLDIDTLRCSAMMEYVRNRVHMERTRRELQQAASTGRDSHLATVATSPHFLRDTLVANLQACVTLVDVDRVVGPPARSNTSHASCMPLSALQGVRVFAPARFLLTLELSGRGPHPLAELVSFDPAQTMFDAAPACRPSITITQPSEGATVRRETSGQIALHAALQLPDLCPARGGGATGCEWRVCVTHRQAGPSAAGTLSQGAGVETCRNVTVNGAGGGEGAGEGAGDGDDVTSLVVAMEGVQPGRILVEVRAQRQEGGDGFEATEVAAGKAAAEDPSAATPICVARAAFEIAASPPIVFAHAHDGSNSHHDGVVVQEERAVVQTTDEGRLSSFAIVTGASQRYFEGRHVHNMIGSLHVWDAMSSAPIVVYDLGLSPEAAQEMSSWDRVEVRRLPLHTLLPHVADTRGTYAFKAAILHEELHRFSTVLWIDANVEVRRPLDELRAILAANGHFLTVQRLGFPNTLRHHPTTVTALGCTAPVGSMTQCWSGVMGISRHSWFHRHVFSHMLNCSLHKDCIAPPGSNRNNHRHDQTVLNAVLCRLEYTPCVPDRGWWSSNLDADGEGGLKPAPDAMEWNQVRLFGRREHAVKPFVAHVRRR